MIANFFKKKMDELKPNKVGKRLAYLLRYGALSEGLNVSKEGYVSLDDLRHVNLLKHQSRDEIIAEVNKETVCGMSRFELVSRDGRDLIRASYGRNFAPAKKHGDSQVTRLLEICLAFVCSHIKLFDLEDFPDSYLLNRIFYRLKFEKKLTNSVMPSVIGNVMDAVDFNGAYITNKTLKLVCQRCPNLQSLSLKECGYLITDNVLQWLLKALPMLKSLNICACESVSDKGIHLISRYSKHIEKLNISCLSLVTKRGLIELVANCLSLKKLYVRANSNVDQPLIDELLTLRSAQTSGTKLQIYATCNT